MRSLKQTLKIKRKHGWMHGEGADSHGDGWTGWSFFETELGRWFLPHTPMMPSISEVTVRLAEVRILLQDIGIKITSFGQKMEPGEQKALSSHRDDYHPTAQGSSFSEAMADSLAYGCLTYFNIQNLAISLPFIYNNIAFFSLKPMTGTWHSRVTAK